VHDAEGDLQGDVKVALVVRREQKPSNLEQ
jgi:hypothetical protein